MSNSGSEEKDPETPRTSKHEDLEHNVKVPPVQKEEEELPFTLIEDEMFTIKDEEKNASMRVTSVNGELNPPFISQKGVDYLQNNFDTNGLDIFVDSYAKCGTTFMIHVVYQILKAGKLPMAGASEQDMADPWTAVPWIDVDTSQQIRKKGNCKEFESFVRKSNEEKKYRLWKTHAAVVNCPWRKLNYNSKVIHITRNPKDVLCSYNKWFRKEPFVKYEGNFDTLFNWFCDGTIVHSSFFDFELQWYNYYKKNKSTVLWVHYEEINGDKNTRTRCIQRIARFLNVKLSQKDIDHIIYETSFNKMKTKAISPTSPMGSNLMNKGTSGRWRNVLSKQQSERIDRLLLCRFHNTGLKYDFGKFTPYV